MKAGCFQMQESLLINRLNHTDMNMYSSGTHNCEPGHYYGPAIRDHFLIHYILSGKGSFSTGDKVYQLRKGQGFLIYPDIVTYYQADVESPWKYSWVGFNGLKAESYLKSAGFSAENPIFTYDKDDYIKDCFDQMIAAKMLQKGREIRLLGLLYLFLSQLMEANGKDRFTDQSGDRKDVYIKKAIEYIEMNYSRDMSISDVAHHVGLDRSYLGSIFKEQLDSSMQEFLVGYRINKACELMKNDSLSIGDISRSVGYDDQLLFSKIFRKNKSMSPREYRKSYRLGVELIKDI
jgi:AraC-like DNA-binding protein